MMRIRFVLQLALLGCGLGVSCHALRPPQLRPPPQRLARTRTACMNLVNVGDQIVAGNDWNSSSPEYGVVRAQTYELQRVYFQGVVDGKVKRVDVGTLDAAPPEGCAGFTKYLVLFSGRYHSNTGPVVVRPNEVDVVTVKDEIAASAWLALPGLFWVWLAYTIYQYGVEHGFVF